MVRGGFGKRRQFFRFFLWIYKDDIDYKDYEEILIPVVYRASNARRRWSSGRAPCFPRHQICPAKAKLQRTVAWPDLWGWGSPLILLHSISSLTCWSPLPSSNNHAIKASRWWNLRLVNLQLLAGERSASGHAYPGLKDVLRSERRWPLPGKSSQTFYSYGVVATMLPFEPKIEATDLIFSLLVLEFWNWNVWLDILQ